MPENGTLGAQVFWDFFHIFWVEDKVNSWWDSIYGDIPTTKRAENRRSFSATKPTATVPWDHLYLNHMTDIGMDIGFLFASGG